MTDQEYSGSSKVAATYHQAFEDQDAQARAIEAGEDPVVVLGYHPEGSGWHPTVREGDRLEDVSLDQWVGEALGAASMCWSETPKGVFDSTRAAAIADALLGQFKLMLRAFVDESERRRKVSDGYLLERLSQIEDLHYDEETLEKVRVGLGTVLSKERNITDAITAMQNEGILFRERKPVAAKGNG